MKTLIIVDMQVDFISGSLANVEAQKIIPNMKNFIKEFEGDIICTRDTHYSDYLETQEGKNLPIYHCQYGTEGWELDENIWQVVKEKPNFIVINKDTFGDISAICEELDPYTDEIYLCGVCTDICLISIGLNLKARYPEIKMYCIADLCAGLTPEKHAAALEVMKSCQIEVI